IEAAAFFFADGDALEDPRRPAVALPEAGDRLDRRDDAESAVERAAAADSVDVRSGDDRATAARALDPPPHVADGVAAHEELPSFEPRRDQLHGRGPRRTIERPIEAAARKRTALREVVETPKEAAFVDLDELDRTRAHAAVPSSILGMNRPVGPSVTMSPS